MRLTPPGPWSHSVALKGFGALSQATQRGAHTGERIRSFCPAPGTPLAIGQQKERLGIQGASTPPPCPPRWRAQATYQDVQTGRLQQGDLVCDGQASEAWQTFSKLHDLNNALGSQFTEFVPEAQIQSNSMVGTGILRRRENTVRGSCGKPSGRQGTEHVSHRMC